VNDMAEEEYGKGVPMVIEPKMGELIEWSKISVTGPS